MKQKEASQLPQNEASSDAYTLNIYPKLVVKERLRLCHFNGFDWDDVENGSNSYVFFILSLPSIGPNMDFLGIFVVLNNVTNIYFFGVGIDSSRGIAGILKMYQGGIGQGFSVQSRPTQPIEACVEKETKQDGNNVRSMRNKIYTETEMKIVGNKRTNNVDGSCTIWFRGKPTLPNRFVNGIRNVVMGQHGHDLTILVPSIPPYLVQGWLVFGF